MLWSAEVFLLAAAFLLILCIKFVNMKESSPTGKYAGKTEKWSRLQPIKRNRRSLTGRRKNFRDDIGRKSGTVIYHYAGSIDRNGKGNGSRRHDKKMPGTVSGWWRDLILQGILRTDNNYQIYFTLRSRTVQSRVEIPNFSECR